MKVYTFPERLKEARYYAKLRQKDVAEMSGISISAYINHETGKTFPTIDKLHDLCRVLNCPAGWLVGDCFTKDDQSNDQIPPWKSKK